MEGQPGHGEDRARARKLTAGEAQMDLNTPLNVAYSAMTAESARLKVIAENLANADSTAKIPGGEPYRRQVVTFADVFDKEVGAKRVKVSGVIPRRSRSRWWVLSRRASRACSAQRTAVMRWTP